MDAEKADLLFGKAIYRDDNCVVRMVVGRRRNGTRYADFRVHEVDPNGQECIPRGYMNGENALHYTLPARPVKSTVSI